MSASPRLDALRSSVAHLNDLVAGLDDSDLVVRAYPVEWTVADVLSHIGSGAVIFERRLKDALAGRPTPDDLTPGVWAAWNAKPPRAKADDGLIADRALFDRLDAMTDGERSAFRFPIGPMEFDFDDTVGMRLNEHALHTWDIEVVFDPTATVPADAVAQVIDNLELIGRFTAKPTGATGTIVVRTAGPTRTFTVTLTAERVGFDTGGGHPTLELPAEAFVRLVYGRLDPAHSVPIEGDTGALDTLRLVFPGP